MTTTWNPSDKNSRISLSNGNLTASGSGAPASNANVRAINSVSVGQKVYFECTYVSQGANTDGFIIGFMTGTFSLSARFGTGQSVGYDPDDTTGIVVYNSSAIGHAAFGSVPEVIRIAADLVNNQIYVALNGGLWNNSATANPATNVGGFSIAAIPKPIFPAAELWQTGYVCTAAFSPSDWQFACPAGFTEVNPPVTVGSSFYASIIG